MKDLCRPYPSPVTVRACCPAPASTLADSASDISTMAHPDKAISSTANRQSRWASSPAPAVGSGPVTAAMMRARRSSSRTSPPPATHLSVPEIAAEMFVSRNTVKSHTSSIYGKLGTSSRSQAVSRLRELGLLEA